MPKSHRAADPILVAALIVAVALVPWVIGTPAFGGTSLDTRRAADRLVASQLPGGGWGELGLEGEIIAGLENAFRQYGEASYGAAAQTGGNYILTRDGFNGSQYAQLPFAAETYALSRLAQRDPANFMGPTRAVFSQARSAFGSSNAYIDATVDFHLNALGNPIHSAVYDIARQAVAARIVDDVDTDVYRSRLMQHLAEVADGGSNPSVFALGVSVWALARTGPLDGTTLSGTSPQLNGRTLAELPDLLGAHQVSDPNDGAPGDFYWRFDHAGAPPAGITDSTAFATMGMNAATDLDATAYPFVGQIASARQVLADGVDTGGEAYFFIGDPSFGGGHFYAGETLEAVAEPGSIAFVPLPSAAWMGLVLLAGAGTVTAVRRRLRSSC